MKKNKPSQKQSSATLISKLKTEAEEKPTSIFAPASDSINLKTSQPNTTPEQWHNMVCKKAYELYEKRGYTPGNELGDWFEAEKIMQHQHRQQ